MKTILALAVNSMFLLAAASGSLSLVVLGDQTGTIKPDVFEQILDEVRILKPDLVVSVGDLIEGSPRIRDSIERQWDSAVRLLGSMKVPYRLTPGNHDIGNAMMESVYTRRFGATYYSFDRGNYHFVVLDNSRAESAAAIPAAQLAWLERDLAASRNARWSFVFMHRSYWTGLRRTGKTDTLHKLFKQYGVDYVFSGHDHYYCRTVWDGIVYTQVGPSGSRYKVYTDEARGAFQNYLLAAVSDTGVTLTVIRPGGLLPPDCVTLDEIIQVDSIERFGLNLPAVVLRPSLPVNESLAVTVTNLTRDVLVGSCVWSRAGSAWQVEPETLVVASNPGLSRTNSYKVRLRSDANPYPTPVLSLTYPYGAGKQHCLQRALPITRRAECPRIAAPRLDGRLDDKIWKKLKPVRGFGASDGRASRNEPTEVWFAHDDSMLYLATRCTETRMAALKTTAAERDGDVPEDDNLNLLLAPDADSGTYYQLIVTPAGMVWDRRCRMENGQSIKDKKWNGNWQVTVGRDVNHWLLEIAAPLSDFPGYARRWGFNIVRFRARDETVSTYQVPFIHDPKTFATLEFR